jgi:hypothetical protein
VSDKLLNLCAQSVAEVAVNEVNEDPMNGSCFFSIT